MQFSTHSQRKYWTCTSLGALKRRVAAEPWPVNIAAIPSPTARSVLILRVQDRAQSGEYCCIRAVSLVANDKRHPHRRDEARIPGLHHMLSRAQLLQVHRAKALLESLP